MSASPAPALHHSSQAQSTFNPLPVIPRGKVFMTKIHSQVTTTAPFGQAVFTVAQAAEALQCSRKTIYNAMNAGKIRTVKILGARRIPAEEIHRLIQFGTQLAEDEATVQTA